MTDQKTLDDARRRVGAGIDLFKKIIDNEDVDLFIEVANLFPNLDIHRHLAREAIISSLNNDANFDDLYRAMKSDLEAYCDYSCRVNWE